MLDYKLVVKNENNADLRTASKEILHYDVFLGDIIFQIGDCDLSACWGWVPILDFAVCFINLIMKLKSNEEKKFEFSESDSYVLIKRINDAVHLSASYVDKIAIVNYQEFFEASKNFTGKVLKNFVRESPELLKNGYFKNEIVGSYEKNFGKIFFTDSKG